MSTCEWVGVCAWVRVHACMHACIFYLAHSCMWVGVYMYLSVCVFFLLACLSVLTTACPHVCHVCAHAYVCGHVYANLDCFLWSTIICLCMYIWLLCFCACLDMYIYLYRYIHAILCSFYEKMGLGWDRDSETHPCGERRRKKKERKEDEREKWKERRRRKMKETR